MKRLGVTGNHGSAALRRAARRCPQAQRRIPPRLPAHFRQAARKWRGRAQGRPACQWLLSLGPRPGPCRRCHHHTPGQPPRRVGLARGREPPGQLGARKDRACRPGGYPTFLPGGCGRACFSCFSAGQARTVAPNDAAGREGAGRRRASALPRGCRGCALNAPVAQWLCGRRLACCA